MPGLYLRGSLKKTMRDVDQTTKIEIEEIISMVSKDPLLQACRVQFKNALKHTIKSDYKSDSETAEQEFLIAIWRAATAAKCGWGKHPASEQTITDSIQRKKFFQTWIFNYLKQMLLENKPLIQKTEYYEDSPTYEEAKKEVASLLDSNIIKEYRFGECNISTDTNLLSSLTINKLNNIKKIYESKNINIIINENNIEIISLFEKIKIDLIELLSPTIDINTINSFNIRINTNLLPSKTVILMHNLLNKYFIKLDISISEKSIIINDNKHAVSQKKMFKTNRVVTKSVNRNEDDENNSIPEIADMNMDGFKDPDTIKSFYESLSDDAKKVVDIILNPPDAYEERFNTKKPVQKYISEYLGFDLTYIKQLYVEMRIKYVNLIGDSKN